MECVKTRRKREQNIALPVSPPAKILILTKGICSKSKSVCPQRHSSIYPFCTMSRDLPKFQLGRIKNVHN